MADENYFIGVTGLLNHHLLNHHQIHPICTASTGSAPPDMNPPPITWPSTEEYSESILTSYRRTAGGLPLPTTTVVHVPTTETPSTIHEANQNVNVAPVTKHKNNHLPHYLSLPLQSHLPLHPPRKITYRRQHPKTHLSLPQSSPSGYYTNTWL